jgi:hypothetical protein
MRFHHRRRFLQTAVAAAGAALFPAKYAKLAAALKRKVKITDVKCMIVRGTWDWNLVKIETDSGLYGIGEAYWGAGVKDVILNIMKQHLIGEDPLNVDKLYTKVLMRNAGAGAIAGITVTAASGIEIALWDLAGRILETPVCNLLGGRFRDRVRFYRTMQNPTNVNDPASWKSWFNAPGQRRSVGRPSSFRVMVCRWPRIRSSRNPGTIATPAGSRTRTFGASSRAWKLCVRNWGRTLTSASSVTGATTPATSFNSPGHWSR